MDKQIQEIVHAQPFKAEITKNAKGDYQWSAECRGSSPEEVFEKLTAFDQLVKYYVLPPMRNPAKDAIKA